MATQSAQLFENDGTTLVATVTVPAFPDNPTIIGYHERYFTVQGQYSDPDLAYQEQSFLKIVDCAP